MSDHIENRFTLVYGTWGSKSKWTKQGSTFRTLLTAASGSRCSFRRCTWTGANRQADRVLAVEKLRRRLTNQFKTSKNVRHFVVAHSHGGNIALTTALAPEIGSRLSGVVCLNTPFLVTVERTLLYLMVTLVFLALLPFPISILRNAATMPHVPPVGEWQLTVFWLKMNWPVLTASLIPFFLLVALTPRRSWPVLRKNEPRAVPLTQTEFRIAVLFFNAPERVFSRQDIISVLWERRAVSAKVLDFHLSKLREKIAPLSLKIEFSRQEGYRLREAFVA